MAKDTGPSISLDSFLDILTCLQGVLILVIISTGIDAAQTKVLIPTPIERQSEKEPIYIECRQDLLFPVDVATLWSGARAKMAEIARTSGGDQVKTLEAMASPENRVTNSFFEVDLTYSLLGQLALRPNTNSTAAGSALGDRDTMAQDNLMTRTLKSMNKDTQRLILIVRDDNSYRVFKNAQRLSYISQVEVSVQVFDSREPIRFSQITTY